MRRRQWASRKELTKLQALMVINRHNQGEIVSAADLDEAYRLHPHLRRDEQGCSPSPRMRGVRRR